jgi:hypothetical protein
MIRAAVAFPLCIVLIFSAGCGTATPDPVSTALGAVLAGKPVLPVADDVWKDVAEFYRQREGKVAWLCDEPTRRTADTIDVLQSAQGHGLVPGDYGVADLEARSEALAGSGKDAPDRAQRLAELDARITTALLSLGRDVAVGRTTPQVAHWKARRTIPDLVGTLTQATGNVAAWLEKIQPFQAPQNLIGDGPYAPPLLRLKEQTRQSLISFGMGHSASTIQTYSIFIVITL